jgi:hypothetical protein
MVWVDDNAGVLLMMTTKSKSKTKLFWLSGVLIFIFIVGAGWLLAKEQKITHIILNDGVTKAPIPKDIVKSKDCKKYHEWFYSHLTPLAKWGDTCPWAPKPKGEIGEFVVNGVKLWVPRSYLLFSKNETDGEQSGLLLSMIYPGIRPGIETQEKDNDEIVVHIHTCPIGNSSCKYDLNSQHEYEYISEIEKLNLKDKKIYPKKIRYLSELDLTLYEMKNSNKEFYLRGDRFKPSYWLICDGGTRHENWNPGCYSQYGMSNKLYIKYTFRKTDLLKHHDEVKKKVIEKIRE